MAEIVSGASYSTFVNTFRCQPSTQDEVVRINYAELAGVPGDPPPLGRLDRLRAAWV
jgi:hypothetical protein